MSISKKKKSYSIENVVQSVLTLPKLKRQLAVVSVVIWEIWKQRNDLCFNSAIVQPCRSVILTMIENYCLLDRQTSDESPTDLQTSDESPTDLQTSDESPGGNQQLDVQGSGWGSLTNCICRGTDGELALWGI